MKVSIKTKKIIARELLIALGIIASISMMVGIIWTLQRPNITNRDLLEKKRDSITEKILKPYDEYGIVRSGELLRKLIAEEESLNIKLTQNEKKIDFYTGLQEGFGHFFIFALIIVYPGRIIYSVVKWCINTLKN